MKDFTQEPDLPKQQHPIYIIGAGGIVESAHLPAYKLAGFKVAAIMDLNPDRARQLANEYGIPEYFHQLADILNAAPPDAVFDIAVPGSAIAALLEHLPNGSALLMQKPMGDTWPEACRILEICERKNLFAAVNFQLRFAPFTELARSKIGSGELGEICTLNIQLNVATPWHLWDFLKKAPRLEILYHSIHYIDLIRSLLGEPQSIYAKTLKHPAMPGLSGVRSNIIMDYGPWIDASIHANHCHFFGPKNQDARILIEGTLGAIRMRPGVLLNYPHGQDDEFEFTRMVEGQAGPWEPVKLEGNWFPHAFVGSMSELMLAMEDRLQKPVHSVQDCIHTMACVEAAYLSSEGGGVRPA